MSDSDRFPSWILPTLGIGLAVALVAVLFGTVLLRPEVVEQAQASFNTIEQRAEVKAALEEGYPDETFTAEDRVVLNGGRSLLVRMVGSGPDERDPTRAKEMAFDVAKLAFDTHPMADELTHVSVGFSKRSGFGPFAVEENSDPFRFTPEELSQGSGLAIRQP